MLLKFLSSLTIIATPVLGFCSAIITSIPSRSQPGLTDPADYYELVRYAALPQLRPAITDPEHLFNLIYDAREPNCVQAKIERFSGKSSLTIMPSCVGFTIDTMVALSLTQARCDGPNSSCYSCSTETIQIARHYKGFGREQLRMTFLVGQNLLMLEDLSDRVPQGLWMMLRKDDVRYGECRCARLHQFAQKFDILYGKVYSGNGSNLAEGYRKESYTALLLLITGSIVGPVLVVVVCLCFKLLC